MNRRIFLPLLLIAFVSGCTEESTEKQPTPSFIQGAEVASFASSSRSNTTEKLIPLGSKLTFTAKEGFKQKKGNFPITEQAGKATFRQNGGTHLKKRQ